jgi:hypothetical protein
VSGFVQERVLVRLLGKIEDGLVRKEIPTALAWAVRSELLLEVDRAIVED